MEHSSNPTAMAGVKVSERDSQSVISRVSNEKLNELFKNCEAMITGKGKVKYLVALFFIIGLTWVGYGAYKHWFVDYEFANDLFSSQYHILPFIIQTIYEFIVFGLIFPFIGFKFVTILHSMRYICIELTKVEALKIRPLSPDKAGGLGTLGTYSLKMILVLLPLVIPLLLYPIFAELNELLSAGIILFIPALCFAFLYPLSGAHTAMSNYKKQELNLLSREFNKVYDEFIRDIRDNQVRDIPADFTIMENFEKLYQKAERMPVWPFNLEILSKLGAVIAAVGIPILVQVIRILMGL